MSSKAASFAPSPPLAAGGLIIEDEERIVEIVAGEEGEAEAVVEGPKVVSFRGIPPSPGKDRGPSAKPKPKPSHAVAIVDPASLLAGGEDGQPEESSSES